MIQMQEAIVSTKVSKLWSNVTHLDTYTTNNTRYTGSCLRPTNLAMADDPQGSSVVQRTDEFHGQCP